jgi:hypothetical protein
MKLIENSVWHRHIYTVGAQVSPKEGGQSLPFGHPPQPIPPDRFVIYQAWLKVRLRSRRHPDKKLLLGRESQRHRPPPSAVPGLAETVTLGIGHDLGSCTLSLAGQAISWYGG